MITHEKLRQRLYEVVSQFFAKATVIWVEQINTKPSEPYVTLKLGGSKGTLFGCDDNGLKYRTEKTTLEVNLYTKGRQRIVNGKKLTNYVNTAVSDMIDFMDYMDSLEVVDGLAKDGISALPKDGNVNDLSAIDHETQHQYRAMVEFDVTFVRVSGGKYGTSLMDEATNSSGGGSEELQQPISEIAKVEINKEWIVLKEVDKDDEE